MLGSGTTNEVQYLMWTCHTLALNQSSIAAHDTLKVFFKVLSWSLHWLFLGRWPTHDWNGVEYQEGTKDFTLAYDVYWLAEGYAAVLFPIIATWILYIKRGDLRITITNRLRVLGAGRA
jgi:hypothetical protein